jgi:hypothetical protein
MRELMLNIKGFAKRGDASIVAHTLARPVAVAELRTELVSRSGSFEVTLQAY